MTLASVDRVLEFGVLQDTDLRLAMWPYSSPNVTVQL